jgi:LacI family transcriptional regulator
MMKLTLDEIAKRAGVSRTTASRVMNNRPHVRPELRERVLRVIEETGFEPNPVARSLAFQRSKVIGLVLPRSTHTLFTDPYFPRLTLGIAQACNQYDYTLSLFLFETEADEERVIPRISRTGLLDGVIIQVGRIGERLIANMLGGNTPVIVAGRPSDLPEASFVDVDNVAGADKAVTHLIRLGRRRIGTITGALNTTAGLDRREGYRKALEENGIPVNQSLIVEGDFTEIGAFDAMQRLLTRRPDAVFVASDLMAVGALNAIQQAGLSVPDDIAVVGYDDLPPATTARPPLTTIHQPVLRFGAKAVEMLIDIIENGLYPPRQVILDTELVVRESCGAAVGIARN